MTEKEREELNKIAVSLAEEAARLLTLSNSLLGIGVVEKGKEQEHEEIT